MNQYDTIIVGAGPAGLFSAYELTEQTDRRILVIDQGKRPLERQKSRFDYMCGVGGAGCKSDGKLNLNPYVGRDLTETVQSKSKAYELIDHVDRIFTEHGGPEEISMLEDQVESLRQKAAQAGMRYLPVKQKHIGSDNLPAIINEIMKTIEGNGGQFLLGTHVNDILTDDGTVTGVATETGNIYSDHVILAPGRYGSEWFKELLDTHSLQTLYSPIDVGVRVEMQYEIFKELTDINYDPKIHIYTECHHDFVRTFCTNPRGFVAPEQYDGFIGVNGHAEKGRKSNNTNVALLNSIGLTKPQENTLKYGKSIAQLATTIGGGQVILQRLGDLKRGRRSTESRIRKSFVEPTLEHYTPGDITMALPGRIIDNLLEAIEKLDTIAPGIDSSHTLLYAPEIKYYSIKAETTENLESTSITNLYFAGDGAGLTHDIINAAATGIYVGEIIGKGSSPDDKTQEELILL